MNDPWVSVLCNRLYLSCNSQNFAPKIYNSQMLNLKYSRNVRSGILQCYIFKGDRQAAKAVVLMCKLES